MAQHDHEEDIVLTEGYSYESLPPNFSLAANMAAGAFAGIAVSSRRARVEMDGTGR
jgi:solute carrier family 25 (mitochondrial iron transporter), member 28/37